MTVEGKKKQPRS